MGEPKPVATLSSSLLARKGQAKPAMRPQSFAGFGYASHEDLGWNDMGHDAIKPVSGSDELASGPADFEEQPVPPVVIQRKALARGLDAVAEEADENEGEGESRFEAPVLTTKRKVPVEIDTEPRPLPTVAIARAKKAARARKGKAAFTLRLDPERHLKLRLACAIERVSAQTIVTEALDRYLEELPGIDELARKVPVGAAKQVA